MSTSIAHRSGTLLSASPPRIRPRLIEGRSNSSELCRANGSDSMLRKTSCAFRTALSPSQGVAPCAATPLPSSRSASTPFASTPICRSVGSPVIAKSPTKPPSTRWALPRSACSPGSSSPALPTPTPTPRWAPPLSAPPRAPPAPANPQPPPHPVLLPHRRRDHQHRRQRPLHVVGAAPVETVAVDLGVELARAARHHVEVPGQDDRRRLLRPHLGPQHRQPPHLLMRSLDPPRLQPSLDEPSRFQHPFWLSGVVPDQPGGEGYELVAHQPALQGGPLPACQREPVPLRD